jgi:hypothetical protein
VFATVEIVDIVVKKSSPYSASSKLVKRRMDVFTRLVSWAVVGLVVVDEAGRSYRVRISLRSVLSEYEYSDMTYRLNQGMPAPGMLFRATVQVKLILFAVPLVEMSASTYWSITNETSSVAVVDDAPSVVTLSTSPAATVLAAVGVALSMSLRAEPD